MRPEIPDRSFYYASRTFFRFIDAGFYFCDEPCQTFFTKFFKLGQLQKITSVKNNLVSILNQDQVLENSVQSPKLEVKTFITKDRNLLDQYYQMRHDAYTRENGWQGYDGSENKHDRAGNIIVAMKDGKVVGGARIMFSSECETLSNDVLGEDVSHLSIIQKYDKRENLILSEVSAFVVARNERDRSISKMIIEFSMELSKERKCNYICGVGVAAVCRDYRRILKELGYEMEIIMNRQRQESDTYNFVRTFPIHSKLS